MLLTENQFGFRHKHSSIHAVTKLISDITWYINKKNAIGTCFIDLEKAFNKVWINGLIFKLKNYDFPMELIELIFDMVTENQFILVYGANRYSKTFKLENGLMQGTINSPILFCLYLSQLLELLESMKGPKYAIAYADDIVIYTAGEKVKDIQADLQKMFNLISDYCLVWKLKINYSKCETILFRNTVDKTNHDIRKNWKNFEIKSPNQVLIPKKTKVKYLGMMIHMHLNQTEQIKYAIEKGNKAFMASRKLFYEKRILPRVKIIAYQALIRPTITYGVQTWYNISASLMERLRKLERKCIRVCINKVRTPESNYQHYYSNKRIYDIAKIVRIDNFCIKLTRNHYERSLKVNENSLISRIYYHNEDYIKYSMNTGFIAPEHFIYLDSKKFIQGENHVPILYHYSRRATCKAIEFDPGNLNESSLKYDKYIPEKDKNIRRNYWWLDGVYPN
jgi:hypothetical protein